MIVSMTAGEWETWGDVGIKAEGQVFWKTLFSADRTDTEALTLGVAEIPPFEQLAPHRHAEPEIYFILAGRGALLLDGERYEVTPQTAVFIPGNALHALNNSGPDPLRLLYVFAVDSFAEVKYVFIR